MLLYEYLFIIFNKNIYQQEASCKFPFPSSQEFAEYIILLMLLIDESFLGHLLKSKD
jgi:hypothetical protein